MKIVIQGWRGVVVCTVAGALLAVIAFILTPPKYTAITQLYVSAQTGDNPQQAFQGAQLSEQRVKSYTQLVTSDRVTNSVINALQLDMTASELRSQIDASSALDSVVIDIDVTDTSPDRAAAIANATAQSFGNLVTELERPTTADAPPPVAIRLVQPALPPQGPSSVGLAISLIAGILLGAAIGIAVVFIRTSLDKSVRSADAILDTAQAPLLGETPFDKDSARSAIANFRNSQSQWVEAFRTIRTNLQYVNVDDPPQVIMFTSSLMAEGKSTTVANLSAAMAAAGQKVIAVEADLRRPTLSKLLEVESGVGLTTVLSGRIRLQEAVQRVPSGGFDILAAGQLPPNTSELLASHQMAVLVSELRAAYDLILIDSTPLLPVTDAAALAPTTDGAVVLCKFGSTRLEQLSLAVARVRNVSGSVLGVILTQVPLRGGRSSYYGGYGTYEGLERVGKSIPDGGVVPTPIGGSDTREVNTSQMSRGPSPRPRPPSGRASRSGAHESGQNRR